MAQALCCWAALLSVLAVQIHFVSTLQLRTKVCIYRMRFEHAEIGTARKLCAVRRDTGAAVRENSSYAHPVCNAHAHGTAADHCNACILWSACCKASTKATSRVWSNALNCEDQYAAPGLSQHMVCSLLASAPAASAVR